MIRKNSLFYKLIRIKSSSKLLFDSFMAGFRPEMESCPVCGASHSCTTHASYERNLIDFIQGRPVYLQLWTHPRDPPGSDHSLQYLRCLLLLLALYLRPPSLFFSLMPIRCLTGRPFSDHSVLFAFHTTRAFYLRSVCFTMSSQDVIIL